MQSFCKMKKLVCFLMALACLAMINSCAICDDEDHNVEIQFWNQTDAGLVLGLYVKSKTLAEKMGINSSVSCFGEYCYNVEDDEFLLKVDWRLCDYKYERSIPLEGFALGESTLRNFAESFGYLGTDSVFVPIATSKYNLWQWMDTGNSNYLLDFYKLSLQDMGPENQKYKISYAQPLGCCINVNFNESEATAVGLWFHSETFGYNQRLAQTEFLSIIGKRALYKGRKGVRNLCALIKIKF